MVLTYVQLRVKETTYFSSVPNTEDRLPLPPGPLSEVTKGILEEIGVWGIDTLGGLYFRDIQKGQFGPMGWITLGEGFLWVVNLLSGSGPTRYHLTPQVLPVSQ